MSEEKKLPPKRTKCPLCDMPLLVSEKLGIDDDEEHGDGKEHMMRSECCIVCGIVVERPVETFGENPNDTL